MEFIRETTGSLPSTYKRGGGGDRWRAAFWRCYTFLFFLFPFIFAILYVRLCNIVSLSFRGCYIHTLVYISMCVCIIKRPIAVGIRLHPERRRRKKWSEKRKEMEDETRDRHAISIWENDGEGMPLLLLRYQTQYTLHLHSHRLGRRWENKISSAFDYCTSTSSPNQWHGLSSSYLWRSM